MLSDEALEATEDWLKESIAELCECLDSGIKWVPQNLTLPHKSRTIMPQLLKVSLDDLPRPLQTLLKALFELKTDITRETIRQWSNSDATTLANFRHVVAYVCAGLASIERPESSSLEIELQIQKIKKLQSDLQESLIKSTEKKPFLSPRSQEKSIEQAHAAADSSSAWRQRLRALATGPLSSLFESPQANTESEIAEPEIQNEVAPVLQEDIASQLEDAKKELRKLRMALDAKQADFLLLRDHSISALIRKLKSLQVKEPVGHSTTIPLDLQKADDRLQEEIKYFLGTVSVERKALDLYLKSIKANCEYLKFTAEREAYTALSVTTAEWRLQMMDAQP
jgi:hypothetical protein